MAHQENQSRRNDSKNGKKATDAMSERFKSMLEDLGWSQARAAEELKVTRTYINNILNGRGTPSETLFELLTVKASIQIQPEILKQKQKIHREVGEIEKALGQLPAEKREKVLHQLADLIRMFVHKDF